MCQDLKIRQWIMPVFVLLVLAGATYASAQDDDKILVPRSILTSDQIAKAKSTDLRTNVHEWAGLGKEVGEAVNASLSAVTTQANAFAQTGVGKLTVILVVWRVLGDQLIHVAFGVLELLIFLPAWFWSYRKTCIARRIESEKGKYTVVDYLPRGEFTPRMAHALAAMMIIAVILTTVFSY